MNCTIIAHTKNKSRVETIACFFLELRVRDNDIILSYDDEHCALEDAQDLKDSGISNEVKAGLKDFAEQYE